MRNRIIADPQTNYERFQMEKYGNVLVEGETACMMDMQEDFDNGFMDREQIEAALLNHTLNNELYAESRNDD